MLDLKARLASVSILALLTIPASTVGCSLAGCVDRGLEMRRNFSVMVTHQDKPLPGASIQIAGNSGRVEPPIVLRLDW